MMFGTAWFAERPEWYRLGCDGDHVVIDIHPEMARVVRGYEFEATPCLQCLRKSGLSLQFSQALEDGGTFGFGDVGAVSAVEGGWLRISFDLAPIGEQTAKGCNTTINWKQAFITSGTLSVLLGALEVFGQNVVLDEPTSNQRQIVLVTGLITRPGLHGSSLSAALSPEVWPWLTSKPVDRWLEVTETMLSAGVVLSRGFGDGYLDCVRHYTYATLLYPGHLILKCQGDACDLSVDGMFKFEEGCPVWLECHNVDNLVQQLTLLCGLAKVCELYRLENS